MYAENNCKGQAFRKLLDLTNENLTRLKGKTYKFRLGNSCHTVTSVLSNTGRILLFLQIPNSKGPWAKKNTPKCEGHKIKQEQLFRPQTYHLHMSGIALF